MGEPSSKKNCQRVRVPGFPSKAPDFVIRVDTREQTPWFVGSKRETVVDTLKNGDYAIDLDPSLAAVERKSLPDFVQCCGRERARFEAQIARLAGAVENPLVIVEADYGMFEVGSGWRGKMTPPQVLSAFHLFSTRVPFLLCRSRGEAERACYRHLNIAFKQRYDQCRAFARELHLRREEG